MNTITSTARAKLTLRGLRRPVAAPDVDQFAFNWRVGNRRPSRRYASLTEALAEADRLRKLHPDATIITYQATAVVEEAVQS